MRRHFGKCVATVLVCGALTVLGTGCTKYASEENLKQLEVQQQAAISAEQKRDNLLKEKRKLENLKNEKEEELKAVEVEKDVVKERLEAKEVNNSGGESK